MPGRQHERLDVGWGATGQGPLEMRTCSIGGRERQFPISVYQPLACTPQTLSELMAEWDYEPEGTGGLAFYGSGSEFMRSQAICESCCGG